MTTDTQQTDSFLIEDQKAGRATGKIDIKNVEDAMKEVSWIIDKDQAKFFKETDFENWPKATLATYCHDCRDVVPSGIGYTRKGNPRAICGLCASKKITRGKKEALEKFYHLDEDREPIEQRMAGIKPKFENKKPTGENSFHKKSSRFDRKGKK